MREARYKSTEGDPNPSWLSGIWVLLWFIVASAPARVIFFEDSTFISSAFTYAAQVFIIYLLFLILLRFRGSFPKPTNSIGKWSLIYVLAAISSTLFSPYLLKGSTVNTLLLLFQDMGVIATVFVIFRICNNERQLLYHFVWSYAIGTVVLVAALFLFSDALQRWADIGRLSTEFVSATTVAMRVGLAALLLFTLPKSMNIGIPLRWPLTALFLVTTLLAFGKAVIGALTMSLAIWAFLQPGRQMWKSILVTFGVIFIVIILFGDILYRRLLEYIKSPRSLATLTGRTIIWMETIKIFLEHPVLGCGYSPPLYEHVIRPQLPEWHTKRSINQAHNAYLDSLAKVGIVGFFALIRVIQQAIRHLYGIWKETLGTPSTRQICLQGIAVGIFLLIRSIVEGFLNGSMDFAVLLTYGFWAVSERNSYQKYA